MVPAPLSMTDLARRGEGSLEHYLAREQQPMSTLEWLGAAVGRLPDLAARARTADEIPWRASGSASELHASLFEALESELAAAAALVLAALEEHMRSHPAAGRDPDADADAYAQMVASAHHAAPRRAEFLVGGYAAFLSGAIEAAGSLAAAELAEARAPHWDRSSSSLTGPRAGQVYEALVNALGGLVAYARLSAAGQRVTV